MRLKLLSPGEMSAEQKETYDEAISGKRGAPPAPEGFATLRHATIVLPDEGERDRADRRTRLRPRRRGARSRHRGSRRRRARGLRRVPGGPGAGRASQRRRGRGPTVVPARRAGAAFFYFLGLGFSHPPTESVRTRRNWSSPHPIRIASSKAS